MIAFVESTLVEEAETYLFVNRRRYRVSDERREVVVHFMFKSFLLLLDFVWGQLFFDNVSDALSSDEYDSGDCLILVEVSV